MKKLVLLFCLLVGSTGCTVAEHYVEADQETKEFVVPDWTKYFEADSTLTEDQKQLRRLLIQSWERRIEEAKK